MTFKDLLYTFWLGFRIVTPCVLILATVIWLSVNYEVIFWDLFCAGAFIFTCFILGSELK